MDLHVIFTAGLMAHDRKYHGVCIVELTLSFFVDGGDLRHVFLKLCESEFNRVVMRFNKAGVTASKRKNADGFRSGKGEIKS